jgi:hypothetical protein
MLSNQPLIQPEFLPVGLDLGFKTIAVHIKDKIHTAVFTA